MFAEALTAITLAIVVELPLSWVHQPATDGRLGLCFSPCDTEPVSQIMTAYDRAAVPLLSGAEPYQHRLQKDNAALTKLFEQARTCSEIDSFGRLPTDWAGPSTKLPDFTTIAAAQMVVFNQPPSVPMPHVSPSADGEIGFAWTFAEKRVEAILDLEGHLVWFEVVGEQIMPGGEVAFDGGLPHELTEALRF